MAMASHSIVKMVRAFLRWPSVPVPLNRHTYIMMEDVAMPSHPICCLQGASMIWPQHTWHSLIGPSAISSPLAV